MTPKEDWKERFEQFWKEGNYGYNHIGKNSMKAFIQEELTKSYQNGKDELEIRTRDVIEAAGNEIWVWGKYAETVNKLREKYGIK